MSLVEELAAAAIEGRADPGVQQAYRTLGLEAVAEFDCLDLKTLRVDRLRSESRT